MPLICGLVKEFQACHDLPYVDLVHSGHTIYHAPTKCHLIFSTSYVE
uniref:Uncharacterized protein n=1 Tax=Arundo donax TaxID=35708 RepID=A0A0A9EGS3_ARUDO